MEKELFDCIVIGGGPGGYVAAIRAAQRGAKTALIEAKEMGGTCLNRGCIPSKALIANTDVLRKIKEAKNYGIDVPSFSFNYAAMKERKDKVVERLRRGVEGLVSANKIKIFRGVGKFDSETTLKVVGTDNAFLEAKNIIIATGSEARALPDLPFDYTLVHDSTSFLNLNAVPKKLVVIGGGVIGCEFASLHHALGSDVTIVEILPQILSTEGKNVADFLAASFKKQGIKVEVNSSVAKLTKNGSSATLELKDGRKLEADAILVSVGRKYNTDNIGLEKTGVLVEKNGAILTNDRMQTNVPHIYAIGDITAKWLLAHTASHQGLVAADNITGHPAKMKNNAVPAVTFTHPEIASVGLTLEKALEAGHDAAIGKFPFQALGKSQAAMETDGFVQVVIAKSTGQILGAQVVGHDAANLIAEMTLAINNELTVDAVADTIHAHPTLSEAWMEAALQAEEMPLHLPPKLKA